MNRTLPMLHITAARARVAALAPYWREERMRTERMLEANNDRAERGRETRKEAAK